MGLALALLVQCTGSVLLSLNQSLPGVTPRPWEPAHEGVGGPGPEGDAGPGHEGVPVHEVVILPDVLAKPQILRVGCGGWRVEFGQLDI